MRGSRGLCLLLALTLVAAFCAAPVLHGMQLRHDCTGEDCPVCGLLSLCERMMRSLSVLSAVALAGAAAALPAASVAPGGPRGRTGTTPAPRGVCLRI